MGSHSQMAYHSDLISVAIRVSTVGPQIRQSLDSLLATFCRWEDVDLNHRTFSVEELTEISRIVSTFTGVILAFARALADHNILMHLRDDADLLRWLVDSHDALSMFLPKIHTARTDVSKFNKELEYNE